MGREDVYENDYLDNAELFADLINGVLYQGEQVVRPQELSEQDGNFGVFRDMMSGKFSGTRSECGEGQPWQYWW